MSIKKNRIRMWFAMLFLLSISFISNAKVSDNFIEQNNRISISNKSQYSETVIIYFLSESDSIAKWVRIGSYYLQSGHSIGFTIESLGNISNYAFRVQGESAGITRFSKNHMKFE